MAEKFFDKVYDEATPEQNQRLYADWAASYDEEVGENGYATPGRLARALHRYLPEHDIPVLDYGCGTGLSGLALKLAGFTVIDGIDPNPEMRAVAEAKDVYRKLMEMDITDPEPVVPGSYRVIAAIGVIGTGAAPPETFDLLMRALPKGGTLAFSLNDHALSDPVFEGAMCGWLDCGAGRLMVKEYGPHLPGLNLNSNVYIIEKA